VTLWRSVAYAYRWPWFCAHRQEWDDGETTAAVEGGALGLCFHLMAVIRPPLLDPYEMPPYV
jgi:hypothetical protein